MGVFCYMTMDLFHYFQLEVQLLAAKDRRQIKLPKLAREAKGRPMLIEIDQKFYSQRAPQICEADAGGQGLQFCGRVKRERRA